LTETVRLKLEDFTPEDKEEEDNDYHRIARSRVRESVNITDDKCFTVEETRRVITIMDNKKAPCIDGITVEVYKSVFKIFPEYLTAIYNNCLNRGIFPKRWKTSKLIPIVKT
jgi:hypothetical protein